MSGITPPEVLYHYTNIEACASIFEEGILRATDLAYVNDATEVEYGRKLLREKAEALSAQASNQRDDRSKHRVEILNYYLENRQYDKQERIWSISFSRVDDDLGQWRGYTQPARGVCIGFYTPSFEKLNPYLRWVQCIYKENDHEGRVSAWLNKLIENYEGIVVDPSRWENNDPLHTALFTRDREGYSNFHRELDLIAAIKHPGFWREEEWRLVMSGPVHQVYPQPRFAIGSSGTVRPYIDVKFADRGEQTHIGSVRIGPGPERQASAKSLHELLHSQQLKYQVIKKGKYHDVTWSDIPYRSI